MAKNKVPENMTLDEAAEFWDRHSFLDYDDVKEVHFSIVGSNHEPESHIRNNGNE